MRIEAAIAQSSLEALPLDDVLPPSSDLVGQLILFNHRCFTRNGVDAGRTVPPKLLAAFDARKSPHFYIKAGQTKVIFPYDPAWVTTTTAYAELRSGQSRFGGLGVVKQVTDDLSEVFVSPLIIALPRNPALDQFYSSW